MCGVIAHLRTDGKPARKAVAKRYQQQKARGAEGFGYIAFDPTTGEIANIRRRTKENDILAELKKETAPAFLFHHRLPTSTPNLKEAAHPIRVQNPRLARVYYVIHNGIISNDAERKKAHEALGYAYTTEITKRTEWIAHKQTYTSTETMWNDSEALAIDLAEYLEGKADSILAHGSVAAIILEVENKKARALHWIRNNGNPLKVKQKKEHLTIRSEGGGAEVPPDTLHTLDLQTGATATKTLAIPHTPLYDPYAYTTYPKEWRTNYEEDAEDEPMPEALKWSVDTMLESGMTLEELWKTYEEELEERQIELSGLHGRIGYNTGADEIQAEMAALWRKLSEVKDRMKRRLPFAYS